VCEEGRCSRHGRLAFDELCVCARKRKHVRGRGVHIHRLAGHTHTHTFSYTHILTHTHTRFYLVRTVLVDVYHEPEALVGLRRVDVLEGHLEEACVCVYVCV
jgi:hypothetical protein